MNLRNKLIISALLGHLQGVWACDLEQLHRFEQQPFTQEEFELCTATRLLRRRCIDIK